MNLKSQFLTVAKRRIKDGRCTKCGALQPEARRGKWECKACAINYRRQSQCRSHRGPEHKSAHAGGVACLRCDERFESPDRRLFRLCESCRVKAARLSSGVSYVEAFG